MTFHRIADVYKQGILAARIERHEGGTKFSYLPRYLESGGPAVATTLPLTSQAVFTPSGAVPAYFTGLLPEGRRLNSLRRAVKASADDELALLMGAGGDAVGDVQTVPHGEQPAEGGSAVVLDSKLPLDFDALLGDSGLIDPVALAGVQDKLSAGMISLPVAQAGKRFILKLNAPEFPFVVENEFLMFRFARKLRIPVSSVQLVHDVGGRAGLLVERFDRLTGADGVPVRLAVEDGAQVLGLYPADKYSVPFGDVCRALAAHCAAPLPALRNLALQLAFAWLTGNGDLHAKNVSMVQSPGGEYTIAPIYDIPSTVVYGDKTLALGIGGKKSGISRKHFLAWAGRLGLTDRAASGVLELALKASGPLMAELDAGASPFGAAQTRDWIKELKHRRRLMGG
ncbi:MULTISPECIES: type II toxin-antitoxin system HipA family toxin [Arthrobacter]|uniref:Type II toxin-antitoxin system HipA family toxin n=1 Tax=Arthrobacter terricola TaxID=2547396 RepID=A0A4V2ZS04_9MICC|nr:MULTISPECIES: HipA domain-containing protein [Arthrobacter]MBT8163378.1 HipA domain-containing protein [Arthrobacter sp. GN70]TDF90154.1 type II toxin-antitoxin system HipA family toxin [Arthrobacter terricola]